jgi:hypothetical protein
VVFPRWLPYIALGAFSQRLLASSNLRSDLAAGDGIMEPTGPDGPLARKEKWATAWFEEFERDVIIHLNDWQR